jgi:hypothetical protein
MSDIVSLVAEFRISSVLSNKTVQTKTFDEICKLLEKKINIRVHQISYGGNYKSAKNFVTEILVFILVEKRSNGQYYLDLNNDQPINYITKVMYDRANRTSLRIWLDDISLIKQVNVEQNAFKYALRDFIYEKNRHPDFSDIRDLNWIAEKMKIENDEVMRIVSLYNGVESSLESSIGDSNDDRTLIDVLDNGEENPEEEFLREDRLRMIMKISKEILTDLEYRIFSLYYFSEIVHGYLLDKWDIVDILKWPSTTGIDDPTDAQKRQEWKSRARVKNIIDKSRSKLSKHGMFKELLKNKV